MMMHPMHDDDDEGLSAVEDWILFARAVELSSFVVFCVDDDIYSALSVKDPDNVVRLPHSFIYQSSLPRKANITLSLMYRDRKMELVPLLGRWLLELGIVSVYMDLEVLLLRNPLPALLLAYSRGDFSTQVEGRLAETTPTECNARYSEDRMLWGLHSTGGIKLTPDLFILSPDPMKKNRQLLDRWIAILRSREDISGKAAFHEAILFSQKDLRINFQTLDCSHFPNAYRYITVGSWWRPQQPYPPVLVNLKGLRDKHLLMPSLRADRDAAAALLLHPSVSSVEQMTMKGSGGAMSRRLKATGSSSSSSISSSKGGQRSSKLFLLGSSSSGRGPRPLNDSCRIWSRSSPLLEPASSSLTHSSTGRQQQQQQLSPSSSFYASSQYDHHLAAPRFIHLDHKSFSKALSHAFDVHSLAVSLALHYNLTVVYEPLLPLPLPLLSSSTIPEETTATTTTTAATGMKNSTQGDSSSSSRSAKQGLDWLGLHKGAVSPSELHRLYTAEELVIADINPPCSRQVLSLNRSSPSPSPFQQQQQRPGKVMDSRSIKINMESILSSADPHKPLLIRGCGYALSYKPVSGGDPGRVVRYLRSQLDPSWGGMMRGNNNNYQDNNYQGNNNNSGTSDSGRVEGVYNSDGGGGGTGTGRRELDHTRVIAVHIRRGDYLQQQQPQLTSSSASVASSSSVAATSAAGGILSDAYYVDTMCRLLHLLGRDRINRFVVLSEGGSGSHRSEGSHRSGSQQYVDETGQPSDLRGKVQAHCPFYSTAATTASDEGGGSTQQAVLQWDMQYLLDGSASVVETLRTMVSASVLITSKSRLSKMAATYSQGLVVVPSSVFSSYKGIPSIISAPDIVNHKVRTVFPRS